MARISYVFAVALVAGLSSACGGGGDPGTADAGMDGPIDADVDAGPMSPEEFRRASRRSGCEEALRCESRYEAYSPSFFEAKCHPSYASSYDQAQLRAVAEGRAAFDPAAAEACLAGLAEVECFRGRANDVPACSRVFTGLVPPMGPCSYPTYDTVGMLECEAGAYCALGTTCPGECVAPPARGAEGDLCASLFDCDFELRCHDGTCAARLGEGAICVSNDDCQWSPVLICGPGAGSTTVCLDPYAVASAGGACVFAPGLDTCPAELVCVWDAGVLAGTCVTPAGLGAPCDSSTPCGHSARCVDGTCAPIALPDGDCSGGAVCPLTHTCDGATCRPLPSEGQPCTEECFDSACLVDGSVCGFVGGRRAVGEGCDGVSQRCHEGLDCRTGDGSTEQRCFPSC